MKKYSMILIAIFILTLNGCGTMKSTTADAVHSVNEVVETPESTEDVEEDLEEVVETPESTVEDEDDSEEVIETPKAGKFEKRPELYMPRGDAKSFVYDGKKISVEDGEYVQEVEYINDTEIAVLCKISLHMMYFTVYNTEQEKFTFEAKGYGFIWRDEDLSTLYYIAGPYNTGKDYAIFNFKKEQIYNSNNWIKNIKFSGDDKLLVTEIEPEEEGEGKHIEKEIDL